VHSALLVTDAFGSISMGECVLNVGRHQGSTFRAVEAEHREYCGWVLRLPDPAGSLGPFANYLRSKRGGLLTFGQYDGWWYTDVLDHDHSYCIWAVGQMESPSLGLRDFADFVMEHMMHQNCQSPRKRRRLGRSDSEAFLTTQYEVLNLQPGCTSEELRAAYKFALRSWHPDASAWRDASAEDRALAMEQFQQVLYAYDRLSRR
jgi:hypothetical protein